MSRYFIIVQHTQDKAERFADALLRGRTAPVCVFIAGVPDDAILSTMANDGIVKARDALVLGAKNGLHSVKVVREDALTPEHMLAFEYIESIGQTDLHHNMGSLIEMARQRIAEIEQHGVRHRSGIMMKGTT